MANLFGVNMDDVEPDTGRADPIPEGRYVVQMIDSDVVDTKNGTGKMLKATFEVFDGPLKGRKVFENFNIVNENATTQRIALSQLKAMCMAMGLTSTPSDSTELHYLPFEAEVGIEPENVGKDGKTYPPKNRVRKYIFEGNSDQAPPAPKAAPAPAARPAANTGGSRPWERKTA